MGDIAGHCGGFVPRPMAPKIRRFVVDIADRDPDEPMFITVSRKVVDHILDRAPLYATIAVLLLVLGVGAGVTMHLAREGEAKQGDPLLDAIEILEAPIVRAGDTPPEGAKLHFPDEAARDEAALAKFKAIVGDQQNTAAATLARYHIGLILMEQGKPAEAKDFLQRFVENAVRFGSTTPLLALGQYSLGMALEDTGDFAGAEAAFTKLSQRGDGYLKEVGYIGLARVQRRAGNLQAAVDTLRKYLDDNTIPDPKMRDEAEKRLAYYRSFLEAGTKPPVPTPPPPKAETPASDPATPPAAGDLAPPATP